MHEPDDVWPLVGVSGRAKWSVKFLDHLCLALEDEHVGAAQRAHIERLVTRIENENLLHLGRNVPDKADLNASPTGRLVLLAAHCPIDRFLLLR